MLSPSPDPHGLLVRSYLSLRKAIGVLGAGLPFALVTGGLILQEPVIRSSISSYYHSGMRNVFVGSLCAIGVFLWSYRGYDRRDRIAGNLAALCALGVAFFPTTPAGAATAGERTAGALHFGFAAVMFLTLAYFSLVLFRITKNPTPQKLRRNTVYGVCGYVILACIALIPLAGLLPPDSPLRARAPVFWLEAAALLAFGVSWLTKGEAILQDETAPAPAGVVVARP
jgi:hypothetical protein